MFFLNISNVFKHIFRSLSARFQVVFRSIFTTYLFGWNDSNPMLRQNLNRRDSFFSFFSKRQSFSLPTKRQGFSATWAVIVLYFLRISLRSFWNLLNVSKCDFFAMANKIQNQGHALAPSLNHFLHHESCHKS